MRSLIGITCGDTGGSPLKVGVNRSYVKAVQAAGADVVLIPPGTGIGIVRRLQGVLLPGGEDMAPRFYGALPEPELGSVQEDRDELELAVVRESVERGVPLLGICRGHQVLNVALGGTLVQHVAGHDWEGRPRHEPAHAVRVEEGSRLGQILRADCVMVNSGHHQVVGKVAAGLNISAVSEDGQVEGLESGDAGLLSVQWHPEDMTAGNEWARRLFEDLVFRASSKA